ncbi:hypothetical protein TNIN_139621 [Trichonephila inaurata madagascariensis]|uniref:Uncharacterized protein n=1 Tax=Trichonephila inaurata madagascariensis TaxID=2747483 RepID=A0A8X7CKW3_9ARAC|nr:hypothetical protein TNIN_139621 [Trichonephila inaurata madagascariensis]
MGYGRLGINVDKSVLWKESLSIQTVIRGSKTIQHGTSWRVNRAPSSPKGIVQRGCAAWKGRRAAFKGGHIKGDRAKQETGQLKGTQAKRERVKSKRQNSKYRTGQLKGTQAKHERVIETTKH